MEAEEKWKIEEVAGVIVLLLVAVIAVWFVIGSKFEHIGKIATLFLLYPWAMIFPSAKQDYLTLFQHHSSLWNSSSVAGTWYRWIVAPPLILSGILIWKNSVKRRYGKRMNLRELLWHHAHIFPSAMPAAKAMMGGRLDFEPQTSGPWARAKTPQEFLDAAKKVKGAGGDEKKGLKILFVRQLGKRLPTIKSPTSMEAIKVLRFHERCLAVAFAHFIAGTREEGNALFDEISKNFSEKEDSKSGKTEIAIDPKKISSGLKKHAKIINEYVMKHAYSTTMLMDMLDDSRRKGMLPPSKFLWLKPADRSLWYALQQMSAPLPGEKLRHRKVVSEAAGSHAHYKSEILSGRRIEMPMVLIAVQGLDNEIKEWAWNPGEAKAAQAPTLSKIEELLKKAAP